MDHQGVIPADRPTQSKVAQPETRDSHTVYNAVPDSGCIFSARNSHRRRPHLTSYVPPGNRRRVVGYWARMSAYSNVEGWNA